MIVAQLNSRKIRILGNWDLPFSANASYNDGALAQIAPYFGDESLDFSLIGGLDRNRKNDGSFPVRAAN